MGIELGHQPVGIVGAKGTEDPFVRLARVPALLRAVVVERPVGLGLVPQDYGSSY
jgi:hypothetical protein